MSTVHGPYEAETIAAFSNRITAEVDAEFEVKPMVVNSAFMLVNDVSDGGCTAATSVEVIPSSVVTITVKAC
jgi:hypothetical protein